MQFIRFFPPGGSHRRSKDTDLFYFLFSVAFTCCCSCRLDLCAPAVWYKRIDFKRDCLGDSLGGPFELKLHKNKKQHSSVVSPSCGALPLGTESTHLDRSLYLWLGGRYFTMEFTNFQRLCSLLYQRVYFEPMLLPRRHHSCNWTCRWKA